MTFFFDEIINIDLKDCRVLVVDVKFEKKFKVFDLKKVFLVKKNRIS